MEFRILGTLEVVADGLSLQLGGRRQRAVLAVLLLHANRAVSVDSVVEALWGETPPTTAAKTVQVYVSRLRKLLPPDRLVSEPGGYLLRVEQGELDLSRVEALLERAVAAEPEAASACLLEALSLFRGPALAELPFAQAEKARIEELRLTALEERIEAELSLGEHLRLVSELEQLVEEQPLRERLRAQLMLALYRSGRQADALEFFRKTRRSLVDELGLEPGRDLQELEMKILNHDPALLRARPDAAEVERVRDLLERGATRVSTEVSGTRELQEARKAALGLGDPETAAEAESWLGQLAWLRGDQEGAFAHLEQALALLDRRPASKAKAQVFTCSPGGT